MRSSIAAAAGSDGTGAITTSPSASAAASRLGAPEPLYVLATEAASNRVVVGPAAELQTDRVPLTDVVLRRPGAAVDSTRLRYRSAAVGCRLEPDSGGGQLLRLESPVRRPAPGQTAVLYADGLLVGHALIGPIAVN